MIGKPEEKEKYLPTCVFSMVANRHPVGDNSLTDKKRFQNALFFLLVSTSPSFSVICLLQVEKMEFASRCMLYQLYSYP